MHFDAIVVGGGITGLVSAYRLNQKGLKVLLLEKDPRFGGNISTLRQGGYIFEGGPQTILANNRAVWELIESLNAPVEKASPSSQKRYIYKGGKLVPIPLKPWEFFTTPLVSWKSKLFLLGELFKKPFEGEDISVADFVREHFGEEFLKYFVQPFVSGIYAGDAEKLSLRYAFPKLWEIQRRYVSLLKAFFKEKRVAPKGELISFKGGLKTLVDLLVEQIPNKKLNTPVRSVEKSGELYKVITERGTFYGKKVYITTPAWETAEILKKLFPTAEEFKKVYYPPVAVVSLSFPKIGLDGFGFLTPKADGLKILGAIYASSLFPSRCPRREDCLSVFLCGNTQKEVCQQGEEEILNTAVGEIKKVLPQIGEVKFKKLELWKRSIPQYTLGYKKFYDLYAELKRKEPNLFVLSNFLGGSSLAKCIEKGWNLNGNSL